MSTPSQDWSSTYRNRLTVALKITASVAYCADQCSRAGAELSVEIWSTVLASQYRPGATNKETY